MCWWLPYSDIHLVRLTLAAPVGILHDRTVLEISLAVVRACGLTTLASLSSDRPYVRYEEYRRAGGGKSFIQMLRSIGIRRATMSADVFVLEPNLVELESAGEGRPEALTMIQRV